MPKENTMDPYKPPKSLASPSFMDAKLIPVTCPHCQATFDGVPRKSFLGFQKYSCESCRANFNYPLFKGYRITYWVILIAVLLYMALAQTSGQPNLFVILMGIAVVIDGYLLWKRS
jgi:prepilin signal peptidase PulO-like enzyme (type II secretory pathway)